jgi:hypothetical protein
MFDLIDFIKVMGTQFYETTNESQFWEMILKVLGKFSFLCSYDNELQNILVGELCFLPCLGHNEFLW